MSRHEAVSCDSCLKGNFRGRRYKCLICFDYDLCATCYEQGATTTRHTTEHPMQCILTRSDFDLYYGGESLTVEQPQAFTCPYCSKMGFTETALQEHVTADHADTSFEVVCPVCAAIPGGEANLVTNDFAGHLTLEHRTGPRDLISFLDEPTGSRHGTRRIQQPIRGVGGPRARRSNMHFSSALSPSSSRDTVDPIAELLSQLSGVRRTAASQGSTPSQLQQLQMQLHLERQQAARQQLERLPRRPTQNASGGTNSSSGAAGGSSGAGAASTIHNSALPAEAATPTPPLHSQLMLSRCMEPSLSENELERMEQDRADRSLFVQELVLTMICDEESSNKKGGDERVGKVHSAQALWGGSLLPGGAATKVPSRCMLPRPQQPPTTAPIRPPPAPRGTGTIREPVYPQPTPVSPGTARRKPVRPIVHSTTEPPPSH